MLTSIAPSFMNQFGNWLKRLRQMEKSFMSYGTSKPVPIAHMPPHPILVFNFPEIRAESIHFKLILYIVLHSDTFWVFIIIIFLYWFTKRLQIIHQFSF